MIKNKPDILLEYNEILPDELIIDEFNSIKECGVKIKLKKRENHPWAALEWTIPTIIVAYILKPYFETFLKEAGKDHYKILSRKLKKIIAKGRKIDTKLITATQSTKKLDKTYSQSGSVSMIIETRTGRYIKLLFDKDLSKKDWEFALDQLLEYIIENYEKPNENELEKLTYNFTKNKNFKYYAIINKNTKKIEFYDDKKLLKITYKNK